jgi:hypothetical protein
VIVPVLSVPLLAATEKATAPLPAPIAPEVIVIHGALLAAVQGHPSPVVIVKLLFPPLSLTLVLVGERT